MSTRKNLPQPISSSVTEINGKRLTVNVYSHETSVSKLGQFINSKEPMCQCLFANQWMINVLGGLSVPSNIMHTVENCDIDDIEFHSECIIMTHFEDIGVTFEEKLNKITKFDKPVVIDLFCDYNSERREFLKPYFPEMFI